MKNKLLFSFFSILGLIFLPDKQSIGQTWSQAYTANSTFTLPAGVTTLTVECWGGGAGYLASQHVGGGGGAYAKKTITGLIPGTVYNIRVGQGGTGAKGGDTYISLPSVSTTPTPLFYANGGGEIDLVGSNETATRYRDYGGAVTPGADVTYSGGNGVDGNGVNIIGYGGGGAGTTANGGNATGFAPGTGGASYGGNGGGGTTTGNGGLVGGGGGRFASPGSGARGQLNLFYTCPTSGSIAYSAANYSCTNTTLQSATLTGIGTGGTFTSSPAGLSINASGVINPSQSAVGTYTVAYSIAATGTCPAYSTTASVKINPIYVKSFTTATTHNGTSWTFAYLSLEIALDAARISNSKGQIWVSHGTFTPSDTPVGCTTCNNNRDKTFHIPDGISLYGGFAGTEATIESRLQGNPTILSGDISNTSTNTADDAYHVVTVANTGVQVFDGFVITSGNANGTGSYTLSPSTVGQNSGGGITIYNSDIKINNVAVVKNAATYGGLNVNGGSPIITNSVFAENITTGCGGIHADRTNASFANCTVTKNTSQSYGSGVFYRRSSGFPNGNFKNMIVFGNTGSDDVFYDNVTSTDTPMTYSIMGNPTLLSGTGNIKADPVFVNSSDLDGADNKWMTTDDGIVPGGCSPTINAGSNAAMTFSKDIAYQTRLFNTTVDMGAYESQSAPPTNVSAGTISVTTEHNRTYHLVPTPQENLNDFITSSTNPSNLTGLRIFWEKSEDNGITWTKIADSTRMVFRLPNLTVNTSYRRVATCISEYPTAKVDIKVIVPNGAISGKVISPNGVTGVANIQVCAVKTAALNGSPITKQYCTTTAQDGTYTLNSLFYGEKDQNIAPIGTANFVITPYFASHNFTPTTNTKTLNANIPIQENVNFTDNTVYNITGKVFQRMTNAGENSNQTLDEAVDGVQMFKGLGTAATTFTGSVTGVINDVYGQYAISIDNPGTYKIEPKLANHSFSPDNINVNATQDRNNIDFQDVTTRVISGKLTAGCNEYIGTAVLQFTAILPNDAQGNPRTSVFIKRVTTSAGTGNYSITLPARKYEVSVISFTPSGSGSDLSHNTVKDFLNALPKDSLRRDIDATNQILNLVYPRHPVLEITDGLADVCTTPEAFSLMNQNDTTAFKIKVWQGPAKSCPAKDSLVRLTTNIQQDDGNEELVFENTTGVIDVKLVGGIPNIVDLYHKTFNVQYTDKYKRAATAINKNVVVTGLKTNVATFTTVSPQIPLKVLHDPPGDASYSFWESNTTSEQAMRFYVASTLNLGAWAEVKVGAEVSTGIGVEVESKAWGSVRGTLDIGARLGYNYENIVSLSTTQNFSTASNPEVTGSQGDVFIGAAMNLKYAKTNILEYTAPCTLTLREDFIIAPAGFATDYVYSEEHIVNTIIPTLKNFRDIPTNTEPQRNNYSNQIKVWEQLIFNNKLSKLIAPFEKNISFDGAAGAISSTTTASSTKSNTIEFGLEVNAGLAAELGIEVGGSGASGGVTINMKLETGGSASFNSMSSTTTGYVLDDINSGDYFSVDIKKDPFYNTPVFQLVAGTSSCPHEDGTQPRDAMQLVVPVSTVSSVDANGQAEFILLLSNTSQSGEARTYSLSFDQSSNPNGAVVTIGGSPVVGTIQYTIGYLGQVQVVVKVARGASNVFAYTGLTFTLSDNCDGGISKSATLNAYFNSPCSGVSLASPINNFATNFSTIPIIIKDYTLAGLTEVSLEYSKVGVSNWSTAFTKLAAELSPDVAGTLVNWDVTNLPDGQYNLRLKLTCPPNNVTYSQTISGLIDRVAPFLYGNTEPADDNLVIGDQISATYTENLGCENLSNTNVTLKNLRTNAIIPTQLGCYQNKVIIVPTGSMGILNDSMRVTLQGIRDPYGNIKALSDSWKFRLGNSVLATGNNALSLAAAATNGPLNFDPKANTSVISKLENATGTMDFVFSLPANAVSDKLINYTVSGSANFANDYTASFFPSNFSSGRLITSNQFNGTSGTITILAGQKTAILKIDPTGDTNFEPDETIIITINEGGDYGIAASYTMTGTILNDDAQNDCLNGGNPFLLSNNNVGSTAIVAGTYHKSLLETDGKVVAPTNINLKGAKSIVMQPGFEVKAGSVLRAEIEGCPEQGAAYSMPLVENSKPAENNFRFASMSNENTLVASSPVSEVKYEPNVFASVDTQNINFEFTLEKNEKVTLQLLDNYGGEVVRMLDKADYQSGTFNAKIETETLKKGDYFIKMTTNDKKTYQKITIK